MATDALTSHNSSRRISQTGARSFAGLVLSDISIHERFSALIGHALGKHGIAQPIPIFSDARLRLLEFAPAVRHLRTADAIRDVGNVLSSMCAFSKEGASAVRACGPHLLALLPVEGKQRLLSQVLSETNGAVRAHCAYAVVRSCLSREELFALVSSDRVPTLQRLKHAPLDEIIGKVETLRALEPIRVPSYKRASQGEPSAQRRGARDHIAALCDVALLARKALEEIPHMRPLGTVGTVSDVKRSSAKGLNDTYVMISAIARRAERILAAPRCSLSVMDSFIDIATQRLRVACSDGLRLSQSHTLSAKNLWTEKRVEELRCALAMLPDGHRIMTPTLRVIHLAPMKNLGEWRASGRVALGLPGILRHNRRDEFGGASHMIGVTIHEVAHSLQMSGDNPCVTWEASTGIPRTPTNPLFDLSTFASLSTWRVIGPVSPEQVIGKDSIRIDAHLLPLNRPLKVPDGEAFRHLQGSFGDEWIVFRYQPTDKLLYVHRATAAFARSGNASSDPFEDWAEAFTDYLLCPEDLIALAPEKFYYMELHVKLYHITADLPILRAMFSALQTKQTKSIQRISGSEKVRG